MAGIDPKQVQVAEALAAAMSKVADQASKMKDHTQEQAKAMRELSDAMTSLYDKLGIAAEKISETMKQGKENTEQNATQTINSANQVAEAQISAAQKAMATQDALAQGLLDKQAKYHQQKIDMIQEEIDNIENLSDVMNFLNRRLKEKAKESTKVAAALGAATGAMSGLKQGITNVLAIGKGFLSFAGGLIDSLFNIGAAIIAIPFKMFNALLNMSSGGSNELAQAIENLRKEFGALTGPTPKAILGLSTKMTGFADTGLSVWRVFGSLAQRIELLTKLAHTMGATFNTLRSEFVENGGALLAYQKGLGLADEDMKAMAERAITVGSKVGDSLRDVTKHADGMGRAFNMDAKVISRDMAKAAADVKHFANSTAKELSVAVTYARGLGVELGKIVGIMDAFETFDSAAENAAKLSQTFGAQVDAFKMMEAQNPADQIDMVRKAMREAGQDASTFSKQQLKLLASTTGLDEATASQVFSLKNQGKSLEEIRAEAAKNEKKTLTQAEAMKKLADSIERLVQSGSSGGGFFERFFKGFLDGLSWTKEFSGMLRNINQALFATEQIGRQTGASFLDAFPPLRTFFQGLREFFEPAHFTKFFTKFSETLKKFFNDASKGNFSFGKLMDTLKENFFDFFNDQEGPGKKILEGFKGIMNAIKAILISGIEWISSAMAGAISTIADYIADPKKAMASMKSAGEKSGIMAFFGPLVESLGKAWDVLKEPIYRLFTTVGNAIYDYLTSDKFYNLIRPALPYLALALFGPMIGQAILGGIAGIATQMVVKGAGALFSKMFGNKTVQDGLTKSIEGLTKSVSDLSSKVNIPTVPPANATEAVASSKALEQGTGINFKNVMKVLAGLALVVIGIGLVVAAMRYWKVSAKEAMTAAMVVAIAAGAMALSAAAMFVVSKIDPSMMSKAAIGIGITGLAIVAMITVIGLLVKGLRAAKITASEVADVAKALTEVGKAFLVAAGVVVAAMGVGLLASLGGGAGALAALAGFGVITVAVEAMALVILGIMAKLTKLPPDTQLKSKTEAFVLILDALSNFVKVFATIMDSLGTQVTVAGVKIFSTEKDINQIDKLIKTIMGPPGGLISLLNTVFNVLDELSKKSSEKVIETGKLVASIIESLGVVAKAFSPSDEFFKSTKGFLGLGSTTNQALAKYAESAEEIRKNLIKVLEVVNQTIAGFAGMESLNDASLKKVAAVADFYKILPIIIQAITPTTEIYAIAKDKDGKHDPAVMSQINAAYEARADGIRTVLKGLSPAINQLIDSVRDSKPPSAEQMAVLNLIMPLLTTGLGFLASMGNVTAAVMQNAGKLSGNPFATADAFIKKIGQAGTEVFEKIPENAKKAIDGLMKVDLPKDVSGVIQKAGVVKQVLMAIVDVVKTISSITFPSDTSDVAGNVKTVMKSADTVQLMMRGLLRDDDAKLLGFKQAPLIALTNTLKLTEAAVDELMTQKEQATIMKKAMNVVKELSLAVTSLPNIEATKMTSSLETFNLAADNLGKYKFETLAKAMTTVSPGIKSLSDIGDKIKADGLAPAIKTVGDIIEAVQKLDKLLSDVAAAKPIDLKAKLGQIAKSAGLGAKASYTVESNPINLTVNFEVYMDATKVEHAMVTQSSSVIRDRLNYLNNSGIIDSSHDEVKNKWNIHPGMSPIPIVNME